MTSAQNALVPPETDYQLSSGRALERCDWGLSQAFPDLSWSWVCADWFAHDLIQDTGSCKLISLLDLVRGVSVGLTRMERSNASRSGSSCLYPAYLLYDGRPNESEPVTGGLRYRRVIAERYPMNGTRFSAC